MIDPEQTVEGGFETQHIEPVQLRDAAFAPAPARGDAAAVEELVDAVVVRLETIEGPLGSGGSLIARSVGQRPIGSPAFVGRNADLWLVHSALTAADASRLWAPPRLASSSFRA